MDEQEFKTKLTPEQYRVMREKGTETPHSGTYWNHDETGIYTCAACGTILFLSLNKIATQKGWPTFSKPANQSNVVVAKDGGREEVLCKRCSSHLGYLVEENGGKHLEVNSVALSFLALPDIDWEMGEKEESKNEQASQNNSARTISLTIGGITLGAVMGAAAMSYATPPLPMCTPSNEQNEQVTQLPSAPTPVPTSGTSPKPTGGTKATPVAPAVPASPATSTPVASTSTAATSSAADTGVPPNSDGTANTLP